MLSMSIGKEYIHEYVVLSIHRNNKNIIFPNTNSPWQTNYKQCEKTLHPRPWCDSVSLQYCDSVSLKQILRKRIHLELIAT